MISPEEIRLGEGRVTRSDATSRPPSRQWLCGLYPPLHLTTPAVWGNFRPTSRGMELLVVSQARAVPPKSHLFKPGTPECSVLFSLCSEG